MERKNPPNPKCQKFHEYLSNLIGPSAVSLSEDMEMATAPKKARRDDGVKTHTQTTVLSQLPSAQLMRRKTPDAGQKHIPLLLLVVAQTIRLEQQRKSADFQKKCCL